MSILPDDHNHVYSGQDRLRNAWLNVWIKSAEVDTGKRAGVPPNQTSASIMVGPLLLACNIGMDMEPWG